MRPYLSMVSLTTRSASDGLRISPATALCHFSRVIHTLFHVPYKTSPPVFSLSSLAAFSNLSLLYCNWASVDCLYLSSVFYLLEKITAFAPCLTIASHR